MEVTGRLCTVYHQQHSTSLAGHEKCMKCQNASSSCVNVGVQIEGARSMGDDWHQGEKVSWVISNSKGRAGTASGSGLKSSVITDAISPIDHHHLFSVKASPLHKHVMANV